MNKTNYGDEHALYRGKRMINFRPFLCLALSFAAGIALARYFALAALWFGFVYCVGFAAALYRKLCKKRAVFGMLLFTALSCALFLLGALSFSLRVGAFEGSPVFGGEYTVQGTVCRVEMAKEGQELLVGDLTVIGSSGERTSVSFRCLLYAYGEADFSEGDTVRFAAQIETADALQYGRLNASAISDKARYRAFSPVSEIEVLGCSADVFGGVRGRLRDVLFDSLDESVAPVAYAALTGDTGLMESGMLENFRTGGIAHVFAVSGLHIGIVFGAVSFLFQKMRLRALFRVPAVGAVLIFYAGVCGFSASAVRALIMCLVFLSVEAAGMQYDRLTSLSAAALVILLIDPVDLFSVGFQLSVASAAGIILLGGNIGRVLSRLRFLPRKVVGLFSVSLSVQVATFPVLLDAFGYASGVGIFLNVLFVPLFSIVYLVLFSCAALACIFPFAAAAVFCVPEFLLRAIVAPVSALEFGALLIGGISFGGCTALWYGCALTLSDKINLKPTARAVCACVLAAALVVCMFARNVTSSPRMTLHGYYGTDVAILRENGQACVLLSGEADEEYLSRLFMQENIDRVDIAVVLAPASEINTALPALLRAVEVGTLYVRAGSGFVSSFQTVEVREQGGFFTLCGMPAAFVGDAALWLGGYGSPMLVCMQPPEGDVPLCDLLICAAEDEALSAACGAREVVCFEKSDGKISIYRSGELQITWKDDIITIRGYR